MKKAIITCSNSTIELYEFVEDFYLVSQKANTALELLRQGLPTWVSPEKYDEMKLSLWVYNDTRANALCPESKTIESTANPDIPFCFL